ncbi:16038_t:CDS:2 [Rhizophagus irregularis]|nr:16038_t:CDS:2 [Rhizophagus irregularis]
MEAYEIVNINTGCMIKVLEKINHLEFMDDANLISRSKEGLIELYANPKKYELLAVGKKSEANEEDHILDDVTIKINCSSIREGFSQENIKYYAWKKLTTKEYIFLWNTVVIPIIEYQLQCTVLSGTLIDRLDSKIRNLINNINKFIYSSYELVKDVYEAYGNLRVVKNYWNELEKEFLDKDLDSLLNIDCRLNIIEKILEGASKKGDVCGIGWVIFNSINNIISEEHLRIIDNFEVLELEILAIITALMTVKEESKIQIYTDSLGFIKVLFIKRWNELFTKGNSMVN